MAHVTRQRVTKNHAVFTGWFLELSCWKYSKIKTASSKTHTAYEQYRTMVANVKFWGLVGLDSCCGGGGVVLCAAFELYGVSWKDTIPGTMLWKFRVLLFKLASKLEIVRFLKVIYINCVWLIYMLPVKVQNKHRRVGRSHYYGALWAVRAYLHFALSFHVPHEVRADTWAWTGRQKGTSGVHRHANEWFSQRLHRNGISMRFRGLLCQEKKQPTRVFLSTHGNILMDG